MTVNDHIRKRLLRNVPEPNKIKNWTSLENLEKSEWSEEFLELMRNRMMMGAFRYGELGSQRHDMGPKYDRIASTIKRLRLYQKTGNTEHLVDCSNLVMIEYMIGDHPDKHFLAIDDGPHTEEKE